MLSKKQVAGKRFFDFFLALSLVPVVVFPLFLFWIFATVSTGKNGWFVQKRIGRNGKSFYMYKLRSLKGQHHKNIVEIENNKTAFGSWLRSTKLDELPQVFNVLKGDMSWVGPRPDVAGYADALTGENRRILLLRPGITGPATLKYKNEDILLLKQEDPNLYNDSVIWPDKVALNIKYLDTWNFRKDLRFIWKSIFSK